MKTITENDEAFFCDIQAPCFQLLTQEETELIRASKTQVFFRKGDNLTKQGTFSSYVLFVLTGLVRQYIEGSGSRNFNLRIIRPGEFVGLSSVFTNDTYSYSAVAISDCQAYLVEKGAISDIVRTNGLFGFNIIKRYCEQNANLYTTVQNLVYKQMNGRLADVLLYLNASSEMQENVFSLLSRKDLADFVGISMESVVKMLKSYEKEGLIALNEKNIVILDEKALQEISKRG